MKSLTEARNPKSRELDLLSTEEILLLINTEDQLVPTAIRTIIPSLARAIDQAAERMAHGGRVFYVGAGTSGRLGILDASEIPPTFGVPPDLFQGIIAGGYAACYSATEVSEDDADRGADDLKARGCRAEDVVVGIAASGETPYTRGAVAWAQSIGALTVAICCDSNSTIAKMCDRSVTPALGPEVLAGSTRMKAGTAQKLVLNMFSTAVMVRLGHVYSNWMVNVQMKNQKLRARGLRILIEATGASDEDCRKAMEAAGNDLRVSLVMLLSHFDAEQSRASLQANGGNLRKALEAISKQRS